MGTVVLPIALVSVAPGEHCTSIAQVPTDSMSTISNFQRQLAHGLLAKGRLLTSFTYKGAPVLGNARVHHYASASQGLQFAASYKSFKCSPPGDDDPRMDVIIKTPSGMEFTLECRRSWPVAKVKWLITDSEGYKLQEQRLLVDGRQMKDTYTLADYGVAGATAVHVALCLSGGGFAASVPFVDVSNSGSLMQIPFSRSAPKWRSACKGLNVEGVCQNHSCEAFGDTVVDPKSMVSFCLHADAAKCPECDEPFQPATCGFHACQWAYDGAKAGDGGMEFVSNVWTEASGGVYHEFKEEGNIVRWSYLVLTAIPLETLKTKKGDRCPVCWELAVGPDCTTPCTHTYHNECLAAWKRDMPTSGAACLVCNDPI